MIITLILTNNPIQNTHKILRLIEYLRRIIKYSKILLNFILTLPLKKKYEYEYELPMQTHTHVIIIELLFAIIDHTFKTTRLNKNRSKQFSR